MLLYSVLFSVILQYLNELALNIQVYLTMLIGRLLQVED